MPSLAALSGYRSVVRIYADGRVAVPFTAYAGGRSGIPIEELATPEFLEYAQRVFGFTGDERRPQTAAGWLTSDRAAPPKEYCERVADILLRTGEAASAEPSSAAHTVAEPAAARAPVEQPLVER